jgi:hypothetical protein
MLFQYLIHTTHLQQKEKRVVHLQSGWLRHLDQLRQLRQLDP